MWDISHALLAPSCKLDQHAQLAMYNCYELLVKHGEVLDKALSRSRSLAIHISGETKHLLGFFYPQKIK